MADENKGTEFLIDGRVYRLTGADPEYIQKMAAYINRKIAECRKSEGYRSLDADYRALILNLNLTDDYFKAAEAGEELRKQKEDLEKELYSIRHEAVSVKLKLENSLKQQDVLEARVKEWKEKYEHLKRGYSD